VTIREGGRVSPVDQVTVWGGVACRAPLIAACGRAAVDRALREGALVRLYRDRYALPSAHVAVARAHALSGVLCLTSAALHHGWALARQPERVHVAVARGRQISGARLSGVELHRLDPVQAEARGRLVTSKEVTLDQCLRRLPFGEALAVADSALRAGDVSAVRRVAIMARGPGSTQVRRVVEAARADAANPFESVLRAIASTVPGLAVEPQVLITSVTPWARVDLADRDLRIVLEADSFEWHGHRAALVADAGRYNRLVADGWAVLRFTWEDVMLHPELVRATLVALVRRYTDGRDDRGAAA
jgi:very-short-patch-repair endonuclease